MSLVRRKAAAPRFARPRLYQQLAIHITDFIEAQGLSPGDRLPPERGSGPWAFLVGVGLAAES